MSADVHGNFRSVRFLRFDWENAEDLATVRTAGPYDFVLGSDIVYPGNASKVHAPWHCHLECKEPLPRSDSLIFKKRRKVSFSRLTRPISTREYSCCCIFRNLVG